MDRISLGAMYLGDQRCRFLVWAPRARQVEVRIVAPQERLIPLQRGERGYHQAVAEGVTPGSLYLFRLDGTTERPDPASRFQPEGVHGPSQVVDPDFQWEDSSWFGLRLWDYLIYELHVGTFTFEGTFAAVIP
jgi:maltooligosyltrehalose trehalohydrolase